MKGRSYYYFRRGRIRRPLPSPDDPAFSAAYQTAFECWARDGAAASRRGDLRRAATVLVGRARTRSRAKGWPFAMTADDVYALIERQGFRCAMTGLEFSIPRRSDRRRSNPYAPSLDRIDCTRGYEASNVRVVLAAINFALNEWGDATLRAIAEALTRSAPLRTSSAGRDSHGG